MGSQLIGKMSPYVKSTSPNVAIACTNKYKHTEVKPTGFDSYAPFIA
eukprot:CAMPEP_0169394052 /NCGR_PEP_ID=MMETSP1017-20121227/49771_1 /TAXON_ID=342587 /ORGANISM="Karlodinium micrum, Strain CCMP2283" /LENGTH=46 /DNA_ID= /DNA_START= /DNA_END= /DNA_ORIENTATION=